MMGKVRHILLFILISYILSAENTIPTKKILVYIMPGARSHNFVMRELFEYSRTATTENHEYYILIHKSDETLWGEPYNKIIWGELERFHEYFTLALRQVHEDPIFGYTKFNSAMIYIYESFLQSDALGRLKQHNFDMIISDIPNFLFMFLKKELKIETSMYLSPPCTPSIFYGEFEWNSSYLPSIGTPLTSRMSFIERLLNVVYVNGFKGFLEIFQYTQIQPFIEAGYEMEYKLYDHKSLVMMQCPPSIAFNFSKPPSVITFSAVTPRDAKPLEDKTLDSFLNNHPTNIYVSQGTIVDVIRMHEMIEIFEHFQNYGFVLSFKGSFDGIKFPKNVLLVSWVAQNDLLGDKRLHAFITHGGINSVMESLYHQKPVIALGLAIDQVTTSCYVKDHEFGIAIVDKNEVTTANLINGITEILKPGNKYIENSKKYQQLLKSNRNPREEYHYWLQYGLKHGYSSLHINAYKDLYSFQLYNYDILLLFVSVICLLIFLSYKFVAFCMRTRTIPEKQKKE
jgi:hypothetical protein